MSAHLAGIETPCLVADRQRITRNAERMLQRAQSFGIGLRPHLKTTKSAAIARIAHGGKVGPGTVSTLKEADYFLERGFRDLTYAVCITPNKFEHLAALVDRGADLKVLLASATSARAIAEFASGRSAPIRVMLEIDSGDHRTGMAPYDDELTAVARIIDTADGIVLHGLLTHGGHSYRCRSRDAVVAVAEEERSALVDARDKLRAVGIEVPVLSSGSTPTAMLGENFDELAEIRPGVYLAGDLFQAQIGTCAPGDIAVSVLATVIDHDVRRNRMVLDAGGLALSKDRSTADAPVDYGYGLLVTESGEATGQTMIVSGVSQEHGVVTSDSLLPFGLYPIGSRVRILPNHVCMTAASYDRYQVVDGPDTTIVDEWDKVTGW